MWPRTSKYEARYREHTRRLEIGLILYLVQKRIAKDLDVRGEINILEFGSGDGYQIPYLRQLGHLIASDRDLLSHIKNYYKEDFVQCSITLAPFNANTFDVIFSNYVIEHIDDTYSAFQEMKRIGKSHCIYAFSVPTATWLLLSIPAHYWGKVKKLFKWFLGSINGSMNTPLTTTEVKSDLVAKSRGIKQHLVSRILRALLPVGHGRYPGFFHCFRSFQVRRWKDYFQNNGFRIIQIERLLLYAPPEWPIVPTNRLFAKLGLCSSVLFLMGKSASPNREGAIYNEEGIAHHRLCA